MFGYIRHRVGISAGDWLPTIYKSPLGGKSIALSFDDGPSPETTEGVVGLLRSFDAKATFFLCGKRAEQYPDLVRRIVESGSSIYAHGYSHTRLDMLTPADALAELTETEAILARFRPTPSPYIVRLPYGSGHRSAQMHRLLKQWRSDCQLAHWGYSPRDFTLADGCATRAELERNCDAAVEKAFARHAIHGSVVLLHEDPFDVAAPLGPDIAIVLLERILIAARERGLAVTQIQPIRQRFAARYVRLLFME